MWDGTKGKRRGEWGSIQNTKTAIHGDAGHVAKTRDLFELPQQREKDIQHNTTNLLTIQG